MTMSTEGSNERQHLEGVFVRSVVNQIGNLTVQKVDREQLKLTVSELLVESLPELTMHPFMAAEIRESAQRVLSDLLKQKRDVGQEDVTRAAHAAWQRSEMEVAKALVEIVQPDAAGERSFKERPNPRYQSLEARVPPNDTRSYELYLAAGDCFEFHVLGSGWIYLTLRSPSRLTLLGGNELPVESLHELRLFVAGCSGMYEFEFKNASGVREREATLVYRLREPPGRPDVRWGKDEVSLAE